MKLNLAAALSILFVALVASTAVMTAPKSHVEATGPAGGSAPAKLIGTIDPRNLHGSGRGLVSKRFFHPGGDAALAAAKARVATFAPGSGLTGSARRQNLTSSPSPGIGFDGVSYDDTSCRCLPPDGAFAAGPNHLIGAVNTAYKVWDKNGQLLQGPIDFNLFTLGCGLGGLSDPFVDYDAAADRFVIGILSFDFLYDSAVCIAVSRTADPTGQWNLYSVPVTAADGSGDLFDFPHLALGSDAFYVTGNQFTNFAQTFSGARVYAWNKAQMYAGQAQAAGVHFDIPDLTMDTLRPARSVGVAKTMYFVSVDNNCPCNNALLWKWNDPFGINSFVFEGAVPMLPYDQPPNAIQPGGTSITTNDTRTLGAQWINTGSGASIYGIHTIACNPGTGTVACLHWYQLANLDGPPSLVSQGTIGTSGQHRFFPNLAVNKVGDVLLGFAYSSSTDYAGVHTIDLGTGTEAVPRTGQTVVDGSRYGDYAGTTVGADGCTIWHFEEYAKSGTQWGTWATSVAYADCSGGPIPTPTVTPTQTSTPVSLPTPSPTVKCPSGQHRRGGC